MSVTLARASTAQEFMDDMVQFYKDFGVGKLGLHKAFRVAHDDNDKVVMFDNYLETSDTAKYAFCSNVNIGEIPLNKNPYDYDSWLNACREYIYNILSAHHFDTDEADITLTAPVRLRVWEPNYVIRGTVKYKNLLESDGEIITLGGILFLINDNEVLSLVGGSYAKYMEFQSAYAVHFSGMKYAIEHGYDRYNFYGIVGDFNEKNELGGLYTFKKSFSGYVVELIGEFDLILNKPLYYLYHIAFGIYHFAKNLKAKINKKNG